MYRFALTLLSLLFLISQKTACQEDRQPIDEFTGTVIDDSLGYGIPAVHIWNESTRMGEISSNSGKFSLKVTGQDTIVFRAIGYWSKVVVLSASSSQDTEVRLKPKKYEIGEVVVKRFRSYESFLYTATHLELPESEVAELKEHLKVMSISAAVEADRERAAKEKLETGRFGYITPLGKGIDQEKEFRKKIRALKDREQVIHAKFNRELIGEITHLEGDDLSDFIAWCNFDEDYLYEADLYSIIEALNQKFLVFQSKSDTISSVHDN